VPVATNRFEQGTDNYPHRGEEKKEYQTGRPLWGQGDWQPTCSGSGTPGIAGGALRFVQRRRLDQSAAGRTCQGARKGKRARLTNSFWMRMPSSPLGDLIAVRWIGED